MGNLTRLFMVIPGAIRSAVLALPAMPVSLFHRWDVQGAEPIVSYAATAEGGNLPGPVLEFPDEGGRRYVYYVDSVLVERAEDRRAVYYHVYALTLDPMPERVTVNAGARWRWQATCQTRRDTARRAARARAAEAFGLYQYAGRVAESVLRGESGVTADDYDSAWGAACGAALRLDDEARLALVDLLDDNGTARRLACDLADVLTGAVAA